MMSCNLKLLTSTIDLRALKLNIMKYDHVMRIVMRERNEEIIPLTLQSEVIQYLNTERSDDTYEKHVQH